MKDKPFCLGIGASPRRGGNTDLMLEAALGGAERSGARVEQLFLRRLKFSPCIACEACNVDGHCHVKDDLQELYPLLTKADAIFFAFPIYSMGPNAQAKALIDRAQCYWAQRYVLNRPRPFWNGEPSPKVRRSLLLSAAGSTLPDVFGGALRTARYFFKMLGDPLTESCLVDDVDEKGAILKRPEILADAEAKGSRIIQSLVE